MNVLVEVYIDGFDFVADFEMALKSAEAAYSSDYLLLAAGLCLSECGNKFKCLCVCLGQKTGTA